jgi:nitric-oxide synthase
MACVYLPPPQRRHHPWLNVLDGVADECLLLSGNALSARLIDIAKRMSPEILIAYRLVDVRDRREVPRMGVPGYRDQPIAAWDRAAPVDPDEAEDFLRLCYHENQRFGPVEPRVASVRAEIATTGSYVHTSRELTFGAKLAWRNASRCIGRLYWRSLLVLDRRSARTGDEIHADLVRHLEIAAGTQATTAGSDAGDGTQGGAIRPVISIFAPAEPGKPFARVWNDQLIRYAGYRATDGTITGDPSQQEFTAAMEAMGWRGKGSPFDILPLAIEVPGRPVQLYELPEHAILEVPLVHPEFAWFAELGLRWHAVPAIANQRLSIGGVSYPLAPFNGWYMGAEIGARNLGDQQRYNLLPVMAKLMGLDMTSEATLWRDRALVELNRAVLHSFSRAGVKMTDHHTESARFMEHLRREDRAGRRVPADWTWIVPPLSGSVTPVFHRYYDEADQRPNFYLDEEARVLGRTGRPPLPSAKVPKQRDRTTDCTPVRAARRPVRTAAQTGRPEGDVGNATGCPAH